LDIRNTTASQLTPPSLPQLTSPATNARVPPPSTAQQLAARTTTTNLHLREASPQHVSHGSHRERTRTPPSPARPPRVPAAPSSHLCNARATSASPSSPRFRPPRGGTPHHCNRSRSSAQPPRRKSDRYAVSRAVTREGEECESETLISGERICTATCQHLIGQSNWSTGQLWSTGQSQQSTLVKTANMVK